MESYDSKKCIADINRDSGIVTDEDQQFISIDDLDGSFKLNNYHQSIATAATTTTSTSYDDSQQILGKNIDYYGQDEDGDTILHLAVVGCSPKVVEDLIKKCDSDCLNATNNMKQTPLHVASMANRPEMVELLVSGGAKLDVHDWRGNTPLHLACERAFSEVAIIIIEAVLRDINLAAMTSKQQQENSHTNNILDKYLGLKNFDGQSCLHLAASHNQINILDLLINRYDIDLNCQDGKSGATIIHEAITKFNDELVRYILSSSQSRHCNHIDFYGRSPLDMVAMLQRSRLNQIQSDKLSLINELVRDRIKLCISQNIGCCTTTSLRLNDAILDSSSSSSDYTDSDSDMSN